jgi:hypothetical protein
LAYWFVFDFLDDPVEAPFGVVAELHPETAGGLDAPGFNPCSRLITALVSPFHF